MKFSDAVRNPRAASLCWKLRLREYQRSGSSFSSSEIVEILSSFSTEYQSPGAESLSKRAMINDKDFLRFMGSWISNIDSFTGPEIVKLAYLMSVDMDWRDTSLLRSWEGVILSRLDSLNSSDLVDCIVSYSKCRCGSRAFWETMVSAITTADLHESEILRIVEAIRSAGESFYKPKFVLRSFFTRLQSFVGDQTMGAGDVLNLVTVYTKWSDAIDRADLNVFLDEMLQRTGALSFDLPSGSQVIKALADVKVASPVIDTFLFIFEGRIQAMIENSGSAVTTSSLYNAAVGFYRYSVLSQSRFVAKGSTFALLEKALASQLPNIGIKKLANLSLTFSRIWHVTNSPSEIPLNFGPSVARESDFLRGIDSLLLKRLPGASLKDLSKVMLAFSMCRRGSQELWSSMSTILGQLLSSDSGSLSPEHLESILFAVSEMNLVLPDDVKNALVLAALERIHLMHRSFDVLLMFAVRFFEGEERLRLASRVFELMGTEESNRPSVIFMNLAVQQLVDDIDDPTLGELLASTNEDLDLYFKASKSTVKPSLVAGLKKELEKRFGGHLIDEDTLINPLSGLRVDFMIPDSKIAILLSSPQQLIRCNGSDRPTGTGILRHMAVERALGRDWKVVNVSSFELAEKGCTTIVQDILECVQSCDTTAPPSELEEAVLSESLSPDDDTTPQESFDDYDLSPFVRSDRNAAHRARAPPPDSLPWVPSVMTLKQKPRGRRRKKV